MVNATRGSAWEVWKVSEDEWDNEIEVFISEYDNYESADQCARRLRGNGFEAWIERVDEEEGRK